MNGLRRHRGLPLAFALATVSGIAACDSPSAPAPLTLDPNVASVDSSECNRGYIVIQGVVQCQ
jgi:hypothetical protein